MENDVLMLKEVGNIVLDLFTIDELVKKGIKPTKFEWKFNSKNLNLIPVLELYKDERIYKTFEATEFSELLQDLLKKTQELFNCINNPHNSKSIEELLSNLEGSTNDCSRCEFRNVCPIRED